MKTVQPLAATDSLGSAPPVAAPAPVAVAPHQPVRGMLLLAAAVFLFACMDTTTKYLVATYQVPVIVAVRYIVHLLLMIAILGPAQGRGLVRTERTGLVLIRAACLAAASLFAGLALRQMPVAETTAVVFLAPMLVVLIARPILGERIGALGWAAVVAGFVGVLLIVRPGGELDAVGLAYLLGCVAVSVAYNLLSRVLARTESTSAMLFYTALVGAIAFGLLAPWYWGGPPPTTLQVLLFLSMGVTGGLGHFLFTAAFRHATSSVLAPVSYLQLVWAGLLGWLVFHHVPDGVTILGMAVIAAAGVTMAFSLRRA